MEKTNRTNKIIRIAIVGPESTGKTTLAGQLAKYYRTVFVPEYAREYIEHLQRPYSIDDIVAISKLQMELEDELAIKANKLLICDTNLLVTKIWAEFKYGLCPQWIKENYQERQYDLHLLCKIDLPWEADPQREHPHLREELFATYKHELDKQDKPYHIISGLNEIRLQQATKAIEGILH